MPARSYTIHSKYWNQKAFNTFVVSANYIARFIKKTQMKHFFLTVIEYFTNLLPISYMGIAKYLKYKK